MQTCKRCNIRIRGSKRCCPLCEGPLVGEPEDAAFPSVKKSKVSTFSLVKMAGFLFLASEVIFLAVYFLSSTQFTWIPLAMLSSFMLFLDLLMVVYFRNNFLKVFTFQVYAGVIACYFVDRATGFYAWSVVWAIPFALLALIIVTLAVGKGMGMLLGDFVVYLEFDVAVTLLQVIFLIRGENPLPLPAVICMSVTFIGALAGLFFRTRAVKNASSKMFHV